MEHPIYLIPLLPLLGAVFNLFLGRVVWRTLPAGETLFLQGDEADAAYVIVAGRLQIIASDDEGNGRSNHLRARPRERSVTPLVRSGCTRLAHGESLAGYNGHLAPT